MTNNIEDVAGRLQTCVVGCGQCGSRIAAYFNKTPSFLGLRLWHLYPIRCFAIDTDPGLEISLVKAPWNWHDTQDIRIIPLVTPEIMMQRISKKPLRGASDDGYKRPSGAGQFPFMGTLVAEEYLLKETEISKALQETLNERGFTRGALLIANSLTGGTGTGFAPAMPEFFSKFFDQPRIILNLSIVPEITLLNEKRGTFPANIVYGLFQLSRSKRVDAVILADNDVLSKDYGCKGNADYNSLLHEILASILLAPLHEYDCPSFGKTLDFADIQRALRPPRGFGLPELCALSHASKSAPNWICLRLRSSKGRAIYVAEWLQSLVDSVVSKTNLTIKTTIGAVKAPVQSAVCVLSGPPQFFSRILENNNEYYYHLEAYGKQKISPEFRLAFLQFPGMKRVNISLILSGITSLKLEKIYRAVIPPKKQKNEGSLMERIRQLSPKTVEDLMLKEVREELSKEIPSDGEGTT